LGLLLPGVAVGAREVRERQRRRGDLGEAAVGGLVQADVDDRADADVVAVEAGTDAFSDLAGV